MIEKKVQTYTIRYQHSSGAVQEIKHSCAGLDKAKEFARSRCGYPTLIEIYDEDGFLMASKIRGARWCSH